MERLKAILEEINSLICSENAIMRLDNLTREAIQIARKNNYTSLLKELEHTVSKSDYQELMKNKSRPKIRQRHWGETIINLRLDIGNFLS